MSRVTRSWCALIAMHLLTSSAFAEWTVYQWGTGGSWSPTQSHGIRINAPGEYKVYATSGGPGHALDVIDSVSLAENIAPGEVIVHIIRDPNYGGGPGCTDLGSVDITAATPGVLGECRIAGDAATQDDIRATSVSSLLEVAGNVENRIEIASLASDAAILCQELAGLTISSEGTAGHIQIRGAITGAVECLGDVMSFDVSGDIQAPVRVVGNIAMCLVMPDLERSAIPNIYAPVYLDGRVGHLGLTAQVRAPVYVNGPVGECDLQVTVYSELVLRCDYVWSAVASSIQIEPGGVLEIHGNAQWWGSAQLPHWWDVRGVLRIAGELRGHVTLYCDGIAEPIAGVFWIGSIPGELRIQTGMASSGIVVVPGDVSGQLRRQKWPVVGPDVAVEGSIILGQLTGTMEIGTAALPIPLHAAVEILGDVRGGTIKAFGDVKPANANAPSPHIRIDGGFLSDGAEPSVIDIDGTFEGPGRFITVDYDGWDDADDWDPSCSITIGAGGPFNTNRPDLKLYRVSECKGDMDNDGLVTFFDIDPLVAAFGDGAAYNTAFPGLSGSRIWHGDIDCNGQVNFFDIDPFVARLGICSAECGYGAGSMDGMGGGEQMMVQANPAILAAQLSAGISAERLPDLIAAIEQLALNPPEGSTVDWSAVLAALAGI